MLPNGPQAVATWRHACVPAPARAPAPACGWARWSSARGSCPLRLLRRRQAEAAPRPAAARRAVSGCVSDTRVHANAPVWEGVARTHRAAQVSVVRDEALGRAPAMVMVVVVVWTAARHDHGYGHDRAQCQQGVMQAAGWSRPHGVSATHAAHAPCPPLLLPPPTHRTLAPLLLPFAINTHEELMPRSWCGHLLQVERFCRAVYTASSQQQGMARQEGHGSSHGRPDAERGGGGAGAAQAAALACLHACRPAAARYLPSPASSRPGGLAAGQAGRHAVTAQLPASAAPVWDGFAPHQPGFDADAAAGVGRNSPAPTTSPSAPAVAPGPSLLPVKFPAVLCTGWVRRPGGRAAAAAQAGAAIIITRCPCPCSHRRHRDPPSLQAYPLAASRAPPLLGTCACRLPHAVCRCQ